MGEGSDRRRFDRGGHVIEVVSEARAMERQRKRAEVTLVQPEGTGFVIECDEGAYLNGGDTAPPPLSYLTASVAF